MAKLICVDSGSGGNSYAIKTDSEILLIECGVPFNRTLQAIQFNTNNVVGCIVSHSHADHIGYQKQVRGYVIPVYCTPSAAEVNDGIFMLQNKHRYAIGNFKIMSLQVKHGDCECYSYVIDHPECGRIVFATDLEDFPYHIKDVDTLMIEANYSEDIIVEKMMQNEEIRSQSHNHMEINTTLACIERLYSPSLKRVILIHLSSGLSDERAFISAVREKFPILDVYATDKGVVINVDKEEF